MHRHILLALACSSAAATGCSAPPDIAPPAPTPPAAVERAEPVDSGGVSPSAVPWDGGGGPPDTLDGGLHAEVGPLGTGCDPTKPFGTPGVILGAGPDDFIGSASLTGDEKRILYVRRYQVGVNWSWNYYVSSRANVTAPFTGEVLQTHLGFNREPSFDTLFITESGAEVYQSAEKFGQTYPRIYRFSRASANDWKDPVLIDGLAAPTDRSALKGTFVNGAGTTLYYWRYSFNVGEPSQVFKADLQQNPTSAVPIAELNRAQGRDSNPVLTPDELTIHWATDRGGPTLNVWSADRASVSAAFSNLAVVAGVNDPNGADTVPIFVSHDRCRLYLSRMGKVFVASRP